MPIQDSERARATLGIVSKEDLLRVYFMKEDKDNGDGTVSMCMSPKLKEYAKVVLGIKHGVLL